MMMQWTGVQRFRLVPQEVEFRRVTTLAGAMKAFTPSAYHWRRSREPAFIAEAIASAFRRIPTIRNIRSNGDRHRSEELREPPFPRTACEVHLPETVLRVHEPVANIRSWSFAASIVGTPYASRSTRHGAPALQRPADRR